MIGFGLLSAPLSANDLAGSPVSSAAAKHF